jgi:hypothetical protein
MKDFKGMCARCSKKDECTELCPEAEAYVSQDYVPIMEGLININIENREKEIEYGFSDIEDSMSNGISKARYRWAIIKMYEDGKSVQDIMYHVPYSERHIQRIIKECKEKRQNS